MDFFLVYVGAMTIPGLMVCRILGVDEARTALAVAMSFSLLVVILALARMLGLNATGLGVLIAAVYATLGSITVRQWRRKAMPRSPARGLRSIHLLPVGTLSAVAAYAVWAGAYTEVPADAWWHIGRINDRLASLGDGEIGALPAFAGLFEKSAGYWYTIAALFMELTATGIRDALEPLALANTLIFCAAVYSFALFIFRSIEPQEWVRHAVAAASVLFFVTQFGISVFSYVRYYVYAPTFLAYVLYLAAITCVLSYLMDKRYGFVFLVAAAFLAVVAVMVHLQEAVFIAVMAGLVVLLEALRMYRHRAGASGWETKTVSGYEKSRVLAVLGIGVVAYVAVHSIAYLFAIRENPLAHGVMASVHHYVPFLRNMYILKPTYQFYQVVTAWGVVVYILFLFTARRFTTAPYLAAGMAVPLVTVFNPVFTDLFLRFGSPEVLWRMCYMLPLPFLGGYFLAKGLQYCAGEYAWRKRLSGALTAGLLLTLLLPVKTTFFVSPYSKVDTLAPVDASNDHRLWSDLLDFLETKEQSGIITDRVTGYVINGLTEHKYRGYKFYDRYASHVDLSSYADPDFSAKDGWKRLVRFGEFESDRQWMVVINRRNGGISSTGRNGGHWPEDIMHVSKLYSNSFLEYIQTHPELYEEIWRRDRITVYRVKDV